MTNARLDHYVYTRESLERASTLLADGGVMVLSFEAVKPYIAYRMGSCIQEVFGQTPLAFTFATCPSCPSAQPRIPSARLPALPCAYHDIWADSVLPPFPV